MKIPAWALAAVLPFIAGCSKSELSLPMVQKYQTTPGDLFYFRSDDGDFALLDRRGTRDAAAAPVQTMQAFAYVDRVTLSRRTGKSESMLQNGQITDSKPNVERLMFSPDEKWLTGGTADGRVFVWQLEPEELRYQLDQPAAVRALAFPPDGRWLAVGVSSGSAGGTVRLWRFPDAQFVAGFGEMTVNALAFSADGHRLAAGMEDGSLVVANFPLDGAAPTIIPSSAAVVGVSFHANGLYLASAHTDKRVRLWKLPAAQPVLTIEPASPYNPLFPRSFERLAFSRSGKCLGAAYADGEFRIWDTSALGSEK